MLGQLSRVATSLRLGGAIAFTGCFVGVFSGNCVFAQITPDRTLGAESSLVTSPIPGGFRIDGGATRGTNLFHSFSQFSVPTNGIAYFNNPLTIENIISRVTGASVSNIDGLIAANGTANLFLINPNGIIFGPNASLNVGGSFLASTANSLIFGNGFEFSSTTPQAPPLLTVNLPLGLQYGANPGSIVNQSIANNGNGLQVQPGRTFGLVGGEVALEGGILSAPDGRVEIGSVAGNNRVSLTPTGSGYALSYSGVSNFQDIHLTQEAYVTTDGDNGGSIQVQGKNVTLTDGSQMTASLLGTGVGGGLTVNASDSVQVIGTSFDGRFSSGLFARAEQTATGKAGDLRITTGQFLIRDGARVSVATFGAGEGGNLFVNAPDSVQVIGTSFDGRFSSGLFAQAEQTATGKAGDLRITTGQFLIRDGAQVSVATFGAGEGGNLFVNASDSVQVIGTSFDGQLVSNLSAQANPNSTGDAGNLTITTPQLLILGGAFVSADTSGVGKGGILTVNASDSVQVIGESVDGRHGSKLSVQANENATVDAGNLTITTGRLLILGGAFISAGSLGAGKGGNLTVNALDSVQVIGTSTDSKFPSQLSVQAEGTGDAGSLTITTPALLIRDGAQISTSTFGSGKGGNLTIDASKEVQVLGTSFDGRSNSNLSAQAEGTGNAGNLTITTPRLLIRDGAQVSASTLGAGKGGNLMVSASEGVQVIGESANGQFASILSAQAQGTGDAGNLTITTSRLLISNGAQVSAGTLGAAKGGNLIVNASDSVQLIGTSATDSRFPSGLFTSAPAGGTAGNLTVVTRQLSVRDGARVTVSSPQGQAGNLTITADSLFLNRGRISAETAKSGAEGGANITLQGLDLLRMDNESLISASALEDANGGNVTIDSTFIVATPPKGSEGSDITANAIRGNGGRVSITTQGLFGIEFRPKRTPKNDITVSSDFGLAGVFEQNTPGVDPSRGLTNLPTEPVNTEVSQDCQSGHGQSSFTNTGRSGLPVDPYEPLGSSEILADVHPPTQWVSNPGAATSTSTSPTTPSNQIVEANGWVINEKGEVVLVAKVPLAPSQRGCRKI